MAGYDDDRLGAERFIYFELEKDDPRRHHLLSCTYRLHLVPVRKGLFARENSDRAGCCVAFTDHRTGQDKDKIIVNHQTDEHFAGFASRDRI